MKGACSHFYVVGLQQHTALHGPKALQLKDEGLKAGALIGALEHGARRFLTGNFMQLET